MLRFSRVMLARLGLGKIALAVSVLVHAGIAAVATQRAHDVTPIVTLAPAEVAAPDLLSAEPEAPLSPDAAAPPREPAAVGQAPLHAMPRAGTAAPVANQVAPEPALASSVVAAPEPATPHFTMLVAATTALAPGTRTPTAPGASADTGAFSAAPLAESAVDTRASLRSGAPPAYTAQALAAGVETNVPLELVIDEQGAVASARGVTHVGYGLDEAALRAVRQYRFTPAVRGGRAVAVRMRWVVRFQLQ